MNYKPKTKQWFLDRIGKRIYRDSQGFCCAVCGEVVARGLIVEDKQHAEYLEMIDHNFGAEGKFSNYRDKL